MCKCGYINLKTEYPKPVRIDVCANRQSSSAKITTVLKMHANGLLSEYTPFVIHRAKQHILCHCHHNSLSSKSLPQITKRHLGITSGRITGKAHSVVNLITHFY